jgi:hypothetical protein
MVSITNEMFRTIAYISHKHAVVQQDSMLTLGVVVFGLLGV